MPAVLAAAAALRVSYRRLLAAAAGAGTVALGLFPLLTARPGAVALGLWAAYLLRKGYLLVQAQRAVRQLRLEAQFVAHAFEAEALRRCLCRDDHLWAKSRALHGLRALLTSSEQPTHGITAWRLRGQYHRAFRRRLPAPALFDLLLALALLWSVAWVVGSHAFATLPAGWGLFAMPLLLLAEGIHLLMRRRLRRQLARLAHALSRWTLRSGVVEALRGDASAQPYRHTLLYRAPAWFHAPLVS